MDEDADFTTSSSSEVSGEDKTIVFEYVDSERVDSDLEVDPFDEVEICSEGACLPERGYPGRKFGEMVV